MLQQTEKLLEQIKPPARLLCIPTDFISVASDSISNAIDSTSDTTDSSYDATDSTSNGEEGRISPSLVNTGNKTSDVIEPPNCPVKFDNPEDIFARISTELLNTAKADIDRLLIMSSQDLFLLKNCSGLSVALSIDAAAQDLSAERVFSLEKLKVNLPYFSLTLRRAKKDQEEYYKKAAKKEIDEAQGAESSENTKNSSLQTSKVRLWLQVFVFTFFTLGGQAAGNLLGTVYYKQGGQSRWIATSAQTAGFPILLPFFCYPSPKNHDDQQLSIDHQSSVLVRASV
ncbi:putative purine permease 9-like [Capsicum annuum]|nr:putative purine permease 9-like [Capsicum annuum]